MRILLVLSVFLAAMTVQAGVQEKKVNYTYKDKQMTGYLYWDDAVSGKRPGVLVIHEWWGLNDYAKKRAHMLAELGYVAFAADMYGDGETTTEPGHAKKMMQAVTGDVTGWRELGMLGLEQLQKSGLVDADKMAAVGYCFGGASILQLAYAGAPVKGVVSFHGALPAAPADAKDAIDAKILVLHGGADGFVKPEAVAKFTAALKQAGAGYEMVTYEGVRHAFTSPGADSYGIENLKYDEIADKHSWKKMQTFLQELF